MTESPTTTGPALAMLDISDIPRGLLALDALAKEAWVQVLSAGTVQDGRYLVLFAGEVEPVQRSFVRACDAAGTKLRDAVLLPWAEERIAPAIVEGTVRWPAAGDTLGVMQNDASPTLLRAVDAALKGALVEGARAAATNEGQYHAGNAADARSHIAWRSDAAAVRAGSVQRCEYRFTP